MLEIKTYNMLSKSKITALIRQSGNVDKIFGKKFTDIELRSVALLSSSSSNQNNHKIDVEKLEVPSRYADVPISDKSYFDFIWENREKHFNKVAMVSCISFYTCKPF